MYTNNNATRTATTSVAASATDVLLLNGNQFRAGATVFNDSDKTLYLLLDKAPASLTNFTVAMVPLSYFETPFGYTGEIRGIWASGPAGSARVGEAS